MPKFIVIHTIPKKQLEQMYEIPPEKNTMIIDGRKNNNFDAYWVRSWVVPDHDKLYCEWNAKDEESIRKSLESVKGIGIDSINEMQIIDAEDFR